MGSDPTARKCSMICLHNVAYRSIPIFRSVFKVMPPTPKSTGGVLWPVGNASSSLATIFRMNDSDPMIVVYGV